MKRVLSYLYRPTAIFSIIVTIFTITFVSTIYIFYRDGRINSNGPDPNMFGQFGDFIAGVLGTIINFGAIIFLYFNFKEQRRINEKQLELANRDHLRYVQEIKPEIVIETNPFEISIKRESLLLSMRIENADIYHLKVDITTQAKYFNIIWLHCFMHSQSLQKGTLLETTYTYNGPSSPLDPKFDMNLLFLSLSYQDAIGNRYQKNYRMYWHMVPHNEPAVLLKNA